VHDRLLGGPDVWPDHASRDRCRVLGHRFEETFAFLGDDVHWDLAGAEPLDGQDVSLVASCDLYGFAGGMVTTIRSYTVELPS